MYELFVLSELMEQPLHGYVLQSIIGNAIGPTRHMSWGALYPLMRRLEDEGYIEPYDGAGDSGEAVEKGGRQRKVYCITEAGRDRFYALMLEPGAYDADYSDLFSIKLASFSQITPAQRRAILEHYRGYLRFTSDYLRTARQGIPSNPHIPERERPYIVRTIDHRLHVTGADMGWIDGEIARLDGLPPGDDLALHTRLGAGARDIALR